MSAQAPERLSGQGEVGVGFGGEERGKNVNIWRMGRKNGL